MSFKTFSIVVLLTLTNLAYAGPLQDIFPRLCTPGVHDQSEGDFAIYVFCDDAAGTNIAVFVNDYGRYVMPPYSEANRFWQDSAWGTDVLGYYWVPNSNELLIQTSPIYGTGGLYLLKLESQTSTKLYESWDEMCVLNINLSSESIDSVEVNDCTEDGKTVVLVVD